MKNRTGSPETPIAQRVLTVIVLMGLLWALCAGAGAMAASPETSELPMAAAGLKITVPADLQTLEGDEAAHDLGFRYDGYNDALEFTLWVHDARDMTLPEYAAFYASRNQLANVAKDTVNTYPVFRLTDASTPDRLVVLVSDPSADEPDAVYVLTFTCDNDAARKQAESILQTLADY